MNKIVQRTRNRSLAYAAAKRIYPQRATLAKAIRNQRNKNPHLRGSASLTR
jgi:hypothetical protein